MQKTEHEIEKFIQQWINGNELAFNIVIDFYYPRLINASIRMIKNHEDAEELVMNTLLKVWQHKQRLAEVRKFDDYLFGILRQEIAGRARKKVHHAISFEDIKTRDLDAIATEEFDLNYQELQTRYLAAVEKLTPKQREVFLYSREQDLSQQEIAEKTGLSANTVNNHITTALKVLRNEIKEYPLTLLPILYYLSSIPY